MAISNDPWEDGHSVEKGLIRSKNGDLEEMDEVDVIMQVCVGGGVHRLVVLTVVPRGRVWYISWGVLVAACFSALRPTG